MRRRKMIENVKIERFLRGVKKCLALLEGHVLEVVGEEVVEVVEERVALGAALLVVDNVAEVRHGLNENKYNDFNGG